MPALANSTHESMVRDVAGGMTEYDAWRAAGNQSRNYTRFFSRPEVVARLAELREQFNERSAISLGYLPAQLLRLTKADIGNYLEKRPHSASLRVKDITGLPPELRACISEVTIDKAGTLNFKLHDKTKAIETLLKSIGSISEGAIANVHLTRIDRVIVEAPAAKAAPLVAPELTGLHPRLAAILKGNSENVNR
jgi:hypothetical protein